MTMILKMLSKRSLYTAFEIHRHTHIPNVTEDNTNTIEVMMDACGGLK